MAILSAVGSGSPKWRRCSSGAPLRVRRMSLCLPGYYGEMCSSAVPLVPVRGAGVGCVGSRPTCHLGLRDFLGLRHAVFAPFPRRFRVFCLLAVWGGSCGKPRRSAHLGPVATVSKTSSQAARRHEKFLAQDHAVGHLRAARSHQAFRLFLPWRSVCPALKCRHLRAGRAEI